MYFVAALSLFLSHSLPLSRDRVDNRCERLAAVSGFSRSFHLSVIVNNKKNPTIYHNQHFISASLDSGAQQAAAAAENGAL